MQMKDILAAFAACKKPLSHKKYGSKNYPYYACNHYMTALEEYVGLSNVSIEYGQMQYIQIASGQEMFYISCTVTIYDETGSALSRTGYAGREVYLNNDEREVNLSNLPENVQKLAFKNACKAFGLLVPPRDEVSQAPNETTGAPKQTSNEKLRLSFVTEDAFFVCSNQKGKSIYKVKAHLVDGERMKSEISEIVFYPNRTTKYTDLINQYISRAQNSPQKLRLEVTESGIREGIQQYIFCGFIN